MKIIKFTHVNGDFKALKINELQNLSKKTFKVLDIQEVTRRDYEARIKIFLNFIQFRGLNSNTFLEFKNHLRNVPSFTISTKNKYLIASKIFLKELFRQGILSTDLTANIKGFNQNKKHKKEGLKEEDIIQLINFCKDLSPTKENLRLRALLALFLFQGLRQIEVIRLDAKDIDFKTKKAFIRGKGKDDKEAIPLHPETEKILHKYITAYNLKDGALFRSASNNSRNARLTTKSIREIIKGTFKKVGIENSVHGFRHYFTTKLIKAYKGDLIKVSQHTRHKSLEMLQVYNDDILRKEDLPKYYKVFENIKI